MSGPLIIPGADFSGVNLGGYVPMPAGSFVMKITDLEFVTAKTGTPMLNITAVAQSHGEEGHRVTWMVPYQGKSIFNIGNMLLAAGIYIEEELKEMNGTDLDISDLLDSELGVVWAPGDRVDAQGNPYMSTKAYITPDQCTGADELKASVATATTQTPLF